MAREIETAAHEVLTAICGRTQETPVWLMRPGRVECRNRWSLVQEIYQALTGGLLPDTPPPRERRTVDGVFHGTDGRAFIFELDEKQHFNTFRAATLDLYPADLPLGFYIRPWMDRCHQKTKLEGGGFAKPKPPLFPGGNGRHRQRAFRDALTDILPSEYGLLPTLRLGDFAIRDWIFCTNAHDRMKALLEARLTGPRTDLTCCPKKRK